MDQSTRFRGTRHRLYGETKAKFHLYLTPTAHGHLVDLATRHGASPSEVCEQIIRHHATGLALPATNQPSRHQQLSLFDHDNDDQTIPF